ncbi:MAG TPA: hypothetical protein VHM26_15995 [Chitinophagaceae bacterium]|jgi:hypothetical protein|nr:hypothetical protein [Chitinophagaceae bacterium]
MRRNHLLSLLILVICISCGSKKKAPLTGDTISEAGDFVSFYPQATLPYTVETAKMLPQPKAAQQKLDSLLIPQQTFHQFIPDSVLQKDFPKQTGLKIYALARTTAQGGYSFLYTGVHDKKNVNVVYLSVFDKKNKYINSMMIWRNDRDMGKNFETAVVIDKRSTITRTRIRRNADGTNSEGKEIYSYSNDTGFQLVMTEALDDKVTELINPIDTLPRKHKLAADYTNGKMNLVSIRDGRKNDRLSFFIHFEKNNGECTGELKGEAIIRSATLAEYRVSGDPCVLQFRFSNNMVILKEAESCGNYRGLRCSYDGNYPKKKEPAKPKK